MTQTEVARLVGVHPSSVSRHMKNHLLPEARQQLADARQADDIDVLAEIKAMYRRIEPLVKQAEQYQYNWQAIRALHAEARQDLELLAKLVGRLESAPTVNVLISAEWVQVRAVIVNTLAAYPEAQQAVLKALDNAGA